MQAKCSNIIIMYQLFYYCSGIKCILLSPTLIGMNTQIYYFMQYFIVYLAITVRFLVDINKTQFKHNANQNIVIKKLAWNNGARLHGMTIFRWCCKYRLPQDFVNHLATLRKLYFQFLSHWMGYDRGDSIPLDFEPNGILFCSKSKGKLLPWSYPIHIERKWKYSFLSTNKG